MRRTCPGCSPRGSTAGPTTAILDAYEAERQPITEQVSHFAMDHAPSMIKAARARCRRRSRTTGAGGRGARAPRSAAGVRAQRPAVLLRRAELRLLLRRLADHRLRRRAAAGLHDGRRSRRRPCPAAARRTSGSPTAARSTTRWARTTRCCASIRGRGGRSDRRGEQRALSAPPSSTSRRREPHALCPQACTRAARSAYRLARRRPAGRSAGTDRPSARRADRIGRAGR